VILPTLIILAALNGAGTLVMLTALSKAPEGFQDESGFHYAS
jgi:hypothetical protein